MRIAAAVVAAAGMVAGAAQASDKPAIGPAPAWVRPVARPPASAVADEAPVRLLLSDQQVFLERSRQTVYSEFAIKVQTPQGLAAGNISLPWRPETDLLTVHKLQIRRGDQVIDVLKSGQTFTMMRREQNLESAILDGVLTANIQPEGLQVGDVLEFAASVRSSDPVLNGHVEQFAAAWNDVRIDRAHLRVQWPSDLKVKLRRNGALPEPRPVTAGGVTSVELLQDDLRPMLAPKGAPLRFQMGRLVEFSDFSSWAELGALMAPLYARAAVLPATGPLRAELDRIRAASPDPKARAEAALALVQDRIRYVALAMGQGGLVPADTETTWSRRYGDCKAKTALLLALLRELGVDAEPVAVNTLVGDGMDARLPMVGLFNHVLVRARIAGRTYWLDGTRNGDRSLDRIATPAFGWGLPLVPRGAALVRMSPSPLDAPTSLVTIHMDASAGLTAPAPTRIDTVIAGDDAVALNLQLSGLAAEDRDRTLRDYWRRRYDFIDVKTVTASFDAGTNEQKLGMTGLAKMDWSQGWYETDGTGVGYRADFRRDPGPDDDAPFAVPYPVFNKTVQTILLPPRFVGSFDRAKTDVDQTVAGIEYRRRATLTAGEFRIETTERSVAPEFLAKDAPAAQAALRALADRAVYLRAPSSYRPTEAEVKTSLGSTPVTAEEFVRRGDFLLDSGKYDEALRDFDRAVALEPKNLWTLAHRGLAHVWKENYGAAARDLDAAHAIDPRNPVVFRARGLMAIRQGRHADAAAAFTTALEIDPKSGFALGHRAQARRALGEREGALADSAAALEIDPSWPDLYLMRANMFRNEGKPDAALAEIKAMLASDPDLAYAHVAAGKFYAALGRKAESVRAFDRAIAIEPEAYVYLNRAQARPRGDFAERRADLDAALKLDPADFDTRVARADLMDDEGDLKGSLSLWSALAEERPDDLAVLVRRGALRARTGDLAGAGKDFAAARARATRPGELYDLCWVKATTGVLLETALADCDATLAKAPGFSAAIDSRALVLLRLGRTDQAIAEYDRALAEAPGQSTSRFGRALAWARKGDTVKAAADRRAALALDTDVEAEFASYGLKLPVP